MSNVPNCVLDGLLHLMASIVQIQTLIQLTGTILLQTWRKVQTYSPLRQQLKCMSHHTSGPFALHQGSETNFLKVLESFVGGLIWWSDQLPCHSHSSWTVAMRNKCLKIILGEFTRLTTP